jgi:hypothetical protein
LLIAGAILRNLETFSLPWRYVDLPFDGGGYDRIAYLIVAANDDEVGIVKDLRTAQIVCATNSLDVFAENPAAMQSLSQLPFPAETEFQAVAHLRSTTAL